MMRRTISLAGGLALLTTVAAPPLIYTGMGTSSMAVGVLLVAVINVFLFMVVDRLNFEGVHAGTLTVVVALVLSAIFAHGALSFFVHPEFDFDRFWQSEVLLAASIVGAFCFACLIRRLPGTSIDFAVKFVFCVLFITGLAGTLQYSPFARDDLIKPVLFFAEPSHFALSFLPFLLFFVVRSRPILKFALIMASLILALLLQNLTLLVGIVLISLTTLRFAWFLFIVPIAAIALFAVGTEYYAGRLDVSSDTPNLSALVYLQGWERAYLNYVQTHGLGVGLEQFGIVGDRGEIIDSIVALAGVPLNLLDGGSVATKLIGEFGTFGLLLLLAYLGCFLKRILWLRANSVTARSSPDTAQLFLTSCLVMYFIDLFVRGTGYFSPSGFLFLTAILSSLLSKPIHRSRSRSKPILLAHDQEIAL